MTTILEAFPLIGTRDYIHSTTLLNFLDRFQAPDLRPVAIDLRLRQKLRPGARVVIDEGMRADAPANARVGDRNFFFVNTEAPVSVAHQPDRFAEFLPDISHAEGRTWLRPPALCEGSVSDAEVWPRLIQAAKHHAMWHCLPTGYGQGKAKFLLTRISCRKPHPHDALVITTDVVVGENWFRLCVTGDGVLGHVFVALER